MSESIWGKPKLADNWVQFVFDKKSKITRALIGLPHSLCYTTWVVTIVPVKLRRCRRRRVRVRRRNGRCRDVPAPRSPSAETVSAETVAPRRWRRNGGAEMSCSAVKIPGEFFKIYPWNVRKCWHVFSKKTLWYVALSCMNLARSLMKWNSK